MGVRKICKTKKTDKMVKHKKDGKCPKGSVEKRIMTKKGGKKKVAKRKSVRKPAKKKVGRPKKKRK